MNMGSTSGTKTRESCAGKWRRTSILAGGGAMASISTLATTDGDVVVGLGVLATSGGVRVELCSQSLSSCSPSTGTYGCYGCVVA